MSQEWFDQYWWLVLVSIVWEIVWKGWALWKSARNGDKAWFVLLLIINSLGILPIAYIFVFSKRSTTDDKDEQS